MPKESMEDSQNNSTTEYMTSGNNIRTPSNVRSSIVPKSKVVISLPKKKIKLKTPSNISSEESKSVRYSEDEYHLKAKINKIESSPQSNIAQDCSPVPKDGNFQGPYKQEGK